MVKFIKDTTTGGLESAINTFLSENASAHQGTSVFRSGSFYCAFVDYTAATSDSDSEQTGD